MLGAEPCACAPLSAAPVRMQVADAGALRISPQDRFGVSGVQLAGRCRWCDALVLSVALLAGRVQDSGRWGGADAGAWQELGVMPRTWCVQHDAE